MHEYRDAPIAKLMLKVNPACSHIDLYVAAKMLEMCDIEPIPGGGSLAGRSLVLGVGQACALGSRDYGHEVIGIAFHAANVHQQNHWKSRSRSRARFTYSTTKDVLLAMPVGNWDNVFVLQYVDWPDISDFVLEKMREDSRVIVAQKLPTPVLLENFEHEAFRVTKAGYCHPVTEEEEGEWVIVKIR